MGGGYGRLDPTTALIALLFGAVFYVWEVGHSVFKKW
jgi:hypothetical protein